MKKIFVKCHSKQPEIFNIVIATPIRELRGWSLRHEFLIYLKTEEHFLITCRTKMLQIPIETFSTIDILI